MPLYEAECEDCFEEVQFVSSIEGRRNTPECEHCGGRTHLIISACAGLVRFPAAGGHEYISPASGKPITSARERREDFKRTGTRQYEGFEQESKEAKRQKDYAEKKSDAKLHDAVSRAYHQLSPKQKKVLA